MDNREIFQLIGTNCGMELQEIYDYYSEFPMDKTRKHLKKLINKDQIKWDRYEFNGLYITPKGLQEYSEGLV